MNLKNYQQKALDWLRRYYERCRALQEAGERSPVTNGKNLVVEYKAASYGDKADTDEKERLGQLWAARSNGSCLFLMIRGPQELGKIDDLVRKSVREQFELR